MLRDNIIVGGVVYRSQVHVIHLQSVAALSVECHARRIGVRLAYRHSSALYSARCAWLRDAAATPGAHWAISVDSDTGFNAGQMVESLLSVESLVTERALIGAPVRIGGTDKSNVLDFDSKSESGYRRRAGVSWRDCDEYGLIGAIGFGCVAVNLHWLRQHWPAPYPEHVSRYYDEDIAICKSITDRGGLISLCPVRTEHKEHQG